MSVAATRIIATALITFAMVFATARASRSETATADDTARFLAGLPPSPNSSLAALTKDPTWISHARYFDSIFAREENTNLSKIREFSKKYLPNKHGTVLYMFSGPDFSMFFWREPERLSTTSNSSVSTNRETSRIR